MKELTHLDLIEIGYKWVLNKCGFAFKDLRTIQSETPDVIGWADSGSISFLIECKSSRSDFLADKNKMFRKHSFLGMGLYRFYLAPKGLISVSELPEKWGLIEVDDKRKARMTYNPFGKGNIYSNWKDGWVDRNKQGEIAMMYSALRRLHLRRLHLRNRIDEIYNTELIKKGE